MTVVLLGKFLVFKKVSIVVRSFAFLANSFFFFFDKTSSLNLEEFNHVNYLF